MTLSAFVRLAVLASVALAFSGVEAVRALTIELKDVAADRIERHMHYPSTEGAAASGASLRASPGDIISMQWNGWPQGHRGPILTYLAFCGDEPDACMTANKTQLEFFEIDAVGLIDPIERLHVHDTPPGTWATDMLINSNHSWSVQMPRGGRRAHRLPDERLCRGM